MRVLITGAGGQLGRALSAACARRGITAVAGDIDELDVTDAAAVETAVRDAAPDWVLHCAAATEVDRCESEPEWAARANAEAPGNVAAACAVTGAGMVHFSTDFVFDGTRTAPYREDDPVRPLSVYGRTKADGERAVIDRGLARWLLIRTQWVYGPGGRNFPAAILARARAGKPLRVVDDQIGSPTMTEDLAEATLDLIVRHGAGAVESGVYHIANDGVMSWLEFARMVLDNAGLRQVEIAPATSAELRLPAPRPARSALDTAKVVAALGRALPAVDDALRRYLRAEGWLAERDDRPAVKEARE